MVLKFNSHICYHVIKGQLKLPVIGVGFWDKYERRIGKEVEEKCTATLLSVCKIRSFYNHVWGFQNP